MRAARLRISAWLCAFAVFGCAYVQALEFEDHDDFLNLPADAARGFQRSLLGPKPPSTVTVGYGPTAQFKVPVGSQNSLSVLQAAMNKVCAQGGGILSIQKGTYWLDGQLSIGCSKVKVQGAGMTKTILKLVNKAKKWNGIGLITGANINSITLTGFTLDGNKKNQIGGEGPSYGRYGLYISPNQNLMLNKLRVVNFERYGIDPPARGVIAGKDYTGDKTRSLTVINCDASYNNFDGFIFDTVHGVYAANNTATGNGRYGFNLCTGTWNALLENNVITKNGWGDPAISMGGNGCGMMIDSNVLNGQMYVSTNIEYRFNKIIGSQRGGICSKGAKNINIHDNIITDARQCIWVSQVAGVKILRNKCTKTKSGIVNQGDNTGITVLGNTCDKKSC